MAQTILSVVFEVQPHSTSLLRDRIVALRQAEEASDPKYDHLAQAVPDLHFMSMTVAPDDQYDPAFVLEANFDGPPGPFWAQLEAAVGPALRDMLRFMKSPRNGAGPLFDAVTAPGSRLPIAPLLEAMTVRPAVFHQGNRGLDRQRIEREALLFLAARDLADDPKWRALSAGAIHQGLRSDLLARFPWLTEAPPARIPAGEAAMDLARLIGFAWFALLVLAVPALVLASLFHSALLFPLLILTGIYFLVAILDLNTPTGRASKTTWLAGIAACLALAANLRDAVSPVVDWRMPAFAGHPWLWILWLKIAALIGAAASALGLMLWLRQLERGDPAQDDPPQDLEELARIARSEDNTVQNHMISLVHIKPGLLRAVVIRAGLWGLGLLLRVTAHNGYLASMRTIHFAHWGLVSDGGRLMFHSNFDGSWESYLDDFIEKANVGLTLAWTNGVGFPTTRFLILDGATQGRKFKAWARHSMAESPFWFSAYKGLTVNQIERQARLTEGLRRPTLSDKEAATWALDL
ncbi:MAG: hypothetical protein P4L64_02740 [Caulobacteraceae bacterium]|nr:hypothetical protein [Caulobacteraceae bacterium]